MTEMHDDAARQIIHQLRARMLTTSATIDGVQVAATPRRCFETAGRIDSALDVQAVLGVAIDGGPLVYVGDYALTLSGAAALRDHLGELLVILDDEDGSADPRTPRPMTQARSADGAVRPRAGVSRSFSIVACRPGRLTRCAARRRPRRREAAPGPGDGIGGRQITARPRRGTVLRDRHAQGSHTPQLDARDQGASPTPGHPPRISSPSRSTLPVPPRTGQYLTHTVLPLCTPGTHHTVRFDSRSR